MDLQLRILGEDAASSAFTSVSSAARAGLQVVIDFTKESVKAYAESERVQRQLALVAKEYTAALQVQATAISQANAVSDELVMQVQTMLLRYGEAPAAVGDTTQAILDYAAATGTDARSATDALTRGVEAGTGHIKGLGVSFTATGDKAVDLQRAVEVLTQKFGGAGKEDAGSLIGQTRSASEAFGELQESFGSFVVELTGKTGALDAITQAIRSLNEAFAYGRSFVQKGGLSALLEVGKAFISGGEKSVVPGMSSLALVQSSIVQDMVIQQRSEARGQEQLSRATRGTARTSGQSEMFGPAAPTGEQWVQMARAQKEATSGMVESHTRGLEDSIRATREAAARMAAEQQRFSQAGAAVGAAFTTQLAGAIEQLASGGEQDIGQVLASILAGLLGTVGTIVGNILLPGIGGAVGGALGGLAGAGIKAAARGAGGPNVTINTFDQRSTREFFESDGGRGFYNAQRTGRGQGGR